MSRPIWVACALGLVLLVTLPQAVVAATQQRVTWEGLSIVLGHQVSIAMPGGAVITGKAVNLEPEGLLVQVMRTSDSKAYPKGALRVPRTTLRILQLKTKGVKFRVIGTTLGVIGGIAGGAGAALSISPIFSHRNQGAATAAFFGIAIGGASIGYLCGDAADRRLTTIEIVP